MAINTGAVQYALTGTGGAFDKSVGIVTGGEWGEDAALVLREGIGGIGTWVTDMKVWGATLDVTPVDIYGLLTSIKRTSYPAGMPPDIELEMGDDANGLQGTHWTVDTADIALSVNAPLTVKYGLRTYEKLTVIAGKGRVGFPVGGYDPALTTFEWYRGVAQLESTDADVRSISIAIKNNLIERPTLNTKVDDSRPYADHLDAGPEEVEVTVEYLTDHSVNLTGDALATANVSVVAVSSAVVPVTATISVATATVSDWSCALTDSKKHKIYTVKYLLDYNSNALTLTCA